MPDTRECEGKGEEIHNASRQDGTGEDRISVRTNTARPNRGGVDRRQSSSKIAESPRLACTSLAGTGYSNVSLV